MSRTSFILAGIAFVVVALTSTVQLLDWPLAPLAALLLGAVAGWRAANAGPGSTGRALRAGALVGSGALLGAIVGVAVPALIAGNLPGVQQFVQASEPHPEARIPTGLIAPLAGLGGAMIGLVLGLGDLVLSAAGGLAAGAIRGRNRSAHAA